VGELEAAGTFEDLTALGSGEDDIDRQLKALSSTSAVDDELAKMKGELGGGAPAPGQLAAGSEPASAPEAAGAPEPSSTAPPAEQPGEQST
jgi:phage shock protein A